MLTKEQEAEYWAMRNYVAGDCGCCEYIGTCENPFVSSWPSKENCAWKFDSALVREAQEMREKE